jgi:hypothetical protein
VPNLNFFLYFILSLVLKQKKSLCRARANGE